LTPGLALLIPALNEESSIGRVLSSLPPGIYAQVVVVDNGSTDRTGEIARAHGATVVAEPRRGYGSACLRGIAALDPAVEVVVFMDADASDVPEEARALVAPILENRADLVIGSRTKGRVEAGSLTPHQRFGNWLATGLIRLLYGYRYTDLGPFRAIRASSLRALGMGDTGYGWTIEMQIQALRRGLRVTEVPVSYRKRIGVSKISGNVKASVAAGLKILWTIARYYAGWRGTVKQNAAPCPGSDSTHRRP
jgi:glycosyltransferase involved in cell wall biosynthesis